MFGSDTPSLHTPAKAIGVDGTSHEAASLAPTNSISRDGSVSSVPTSQLIEAEWALSDLVDLVAHLDVALEGLRSASPQLGRRYESEVETAVAAANGRERTGSPGRNQRLYELGSAFEALDALDMDDYFVVGVLATPWAVLELLRALQEQLRTHHSIAGINLLSLLRILQRNTTIRSGLIEHGAKIRQKRDQRAYVAKGKRFRADEPKLNPKWRARKPTDGQQYAILKIVAELRAIDPDTPDFRPQTRGQAHDWIATHGGNPRFQSTRRRNLRRVDDGL